MAHITYAPHGLPASGKAVYMSDDRPRPTVAAGNETIYTRSMSDCIAVATFDFGNNNQRTMTHLPGRAADLGFYQALANRISPNTAIIVACGSNGTEYFFKNFDCQTIRAALEGEMRLINKPVNQLQWVYLWTPEEGQSVTNLSHGTIVLQADGQYGRIRRNT